MANGWGGARRGAGRPKNGEPAANDNPEKLRTTAEGKPVKAVSFEALVALVEASRERARTRPRTLDWCPYRIAEHPPAATPPKKLTMAMDDALVGNNSWAQQAWLNGGMLSSVASEGLLFMGYPFLSELAQRPEFRVISETIATEMTRKWIRFKAKGEVDKADKISELTDFLDDLKLRDRCSDVALQDGWFGRSHLFLSPGDVKDEELKTPLGTGRNELTKGKMAKGWLKELRVIEPIWVYPTTYNAQNPLRGDWYNPQVWYVMGQEIHRSRLPTFIGRPVPDLLKPAYSFGGLSLSQMAKPYVDIWLQTRESVAEIVRSFSVMVLETDLATRLMPGGGGAGDVLARAAAFNALRDNQGLFVINKTTEGFQNVSAPLSGLHELQAQSQEHMASVARIPLVKFTGISPAGLNASSDGEMRAFNDTINAYQPKLFGPNLDFVIDVAMITLWGERDPDIVYEWVPLHALTELEEADLDKKQAETAQIRIDSGVIWQEEERSRLANDPRTAYPGLDPEDVPDLKEEEEAGLVPPGAGKGLEAVLDEPDEGGRGGEDAVVPFAGAADEAAFEEGKHPRDNSGKFAKTAGGGAPAAKPEKPKASAFGGLWKEGGNPAENFLLNATHVLSKPANAGQSFRQMLGFMIKEADKHGFGSKIPQLQAKFAEALYKAGAKAIAAGDTDGANKVNDAVSKFEKGAPDAVKAGWAAYQAASDGAVTVPPPKVEAAKPATPPPPKPPAAKATAAELKKAVNPNKLQLQYVPGAPHVPEALKLVEEFNKKWEGKAGLGQAQLEQKVADFKGLEAAMGPIKAKQEEAAQAKQAQAAAQAKAEAEKAKQANAAVMKDLGITEAEAEGFNALVQMLGGKTADVVQAFKSYESQAKGLGYPITGFQAALIKNYSDGGYGAINKALRSGSWTAAQHVYVKMVNKALQQMPRHTGEVKRGTSLPAEHQALYKVGHVVEERAFTSTSTGAGWEGNTKFTVKATGGRGAQIKKLSNYPGENEVLFSARTFFKVTKVEGQPGGKMHVHMEEMEE